MPAAGGTTADPDLDVGVEQVPARSDRVARRETHPVPRLSEFYGIVISDLLGRDFVVGLTFADGTAGEVDLLPHLWGLVVEPLRDDPGLFAQARVDAAKGTIVWPNGADIAPDTLYRESAAARTS